MSDVLERIQARLVGLYGIEGSPLVTPFLCDAAQVVAAGAEVGRGELLLVADDPDGVSVGLYVAPEAVDALRDDADVLERFEAYCLAAEGVSHFVYLSYRQGRSESVSELELELQAEVDKYATALLEGNGVGAIRARSQSIRARLYSDVELVDDEGTAAGDRYRTAIRVASRYAASLERRHVDRGAVGDLVEELRRFYRLSMRQKLHASEG